MKNLKAIPTTFFFWLNFHYAEMPFILSYATLFTANIPQNRAISVLRSITKEIFRECRSFFITEFQRIWKVQNTIAICFSQNEGLLFLLSIWFKHIMLQQVFAICCSERRKKITITQETCSPTIAFYRWLSKVMEHRYRLSPATAFFADTSKRH